MRLLGAGWGSAAITSHENAHAAPGSARSLTLNLQILYCPAAQHERVLPGGCGLSTWLTKQRPSGLKTSKTRADQPGQHHAMFGRSAATCVVWQAITFELMFLCNLLLVLTHGACIFLSCSLALFSRFIRPINTDNGNNNCKDSRDNSY